MRLPQSYPVAVDPSHLNRLICINCGNQYDETDRSKMPNCRGCDDPRDFVPYSGQEWTTLRELYQETDLNTGEPKYKISLWTDPYDSRINALRCVPRVGIGHTPFAIKTPHGIIIWECMAYIDQSTIDMVKQMGKVAAIVISHPHFQGTYLAWAEAFNCPVYMNSADNEWLRREDLKGITRFIDDELEIVPGFKAIRLGGHFPGSMIAEFDNNLFISDTIMTVPSGIFHKNRKEGTASYSFMYSVPNMIPLPPPTICQIWQTIKKLSFTTTFGSGVATYGAGLIVRDRDMDETAKRKGQNAKYKILESAQIQIKAMGHDITPEMGLEL